MMLATTAADIATLIAALAAGIVSIIVALRQNGAVSNVRQIHEQVKTANGHTLGEIVEANDLRDLPAPPPPVP